MLMVFHAGSYVPPDKNKEKMNKQKLTKIISLTLGFLFLLVMIYVGRTWKITNDNLRDNGETSASMLQVGANVWPGNEPLFLARELGYYENSRIRLVEYSSATQVLHAFRNQAIQVASLTLDEVLLLQASRLDSRVILVMDISNGGDAVLVKPEIKSLQGIRGRRVGVEGTALGAFFLARALQTVGLKPSDVDIVPSEIDEQYRKYLEGKVDAVVTFEPVRTRLIAQGAKQVFDSSQIPGEIVDVLVISKDMLESHPDQVEKLLKGWFRALDHLKTNPQDAAFLISKRLKISPEEVLASYTGLKLPNLEDNLKMMSGLESGLLKSAKRLSRFMLDEKLLQHEVDLQDFIYPTAIEKLNEFP